MSKKTLFIILCFLSVVASAQTDVKPDYSKPYFQGNIKVKDTVGIDNILQTADGAVIKAENGAGVLDLRESSTDGKIVLGNGRSFMNVDPAFGIVFSDGQFFVDDVVSTVSMSQTGVGVSMTKGDFTRQGNFSLSFNSLADQTTTNFVSYPTFLSTQNSTFKQNVTSSVIVGGQDIIGKTNNTAYINQLGFNSGELFETLLDYTTATQDNTLTLPNTSGTLATLNDVSSLSLSSVLTAGNTSGSNDISLDNDQVLKATNGGSFINMRNLGVDGQISIEGKGFQSLNGTFFVDQAVGGISSGVDGSSISLTKGDFTKLGQISIVYNDGIDATSANFSSYPTILSSQNSTAKSNIINSNILGGLGVIAKTSNTAYSNKFGFNSGEAFETVLDYTTATQDNTITLPNASGTISLNNIYDGDGTLAGNRTITGGANNLIVTQTTGRFRAGLTEIATQSGLGTIGLAGHDLTNYRFLIGNGTAANVINAPAGKNTEIRVNNSPLWTFNSNGSLTTSTTLGVKVGLTTANTYGLGIQSGLFEFIASGASSDFTFGHGTSGSLTRLVTIKGNGSVGIGTVSPQTSAILDLTSTTKGFLCPRMTTGERDAIVSPAIGLMVFNTTTSEHNVYDGTWKKL